MCKKAAVVHIGWPISGIVFQLKRKLGLQGGELMQDSGLRVKTEPVRVRIFTSAFEIEGKAHAKSGGYTGRVSDILNMSKISFLPLTDVRYRERAGDGEDIIESDCIVVRIDTIEVLDFL